MTTSGVTSWSLTARDIITMALNDPAVVGLVRTPKAIEMDKCLNHLNALLKEFAVGMHLEAEATVTVPANSASGTIEEDVETILAVRVVISATNQRLLGRWERDEYYSIPNRATSGTPTVFYVSEQRDAMTLFIWPVPTVITTLKIDYLRKPDTVTNLNETVDFPEKYQGALWANLAVRCVGLFGVSPPQELVVRSERLRRQIEDAERPASYSFGWDCYA